MQNETAPASDNTPVGGYAPGFYWCACRDCGLRFHGAKLSHQCRPCALAAASAHASPAGPAPDDGLVGALQSLLDRYLELANSGDAGFWDPEEEPEVIAARAALRAHTAQPAAVVRCAECDCEAGGESLQLDQARTGGGRAGGDAPD